MKQIRSLFLLVICVLFLTECKKGADDPAISLRTRKARLTGNWRIKTGSASFASYDKNTPSFNASYKFDGATFTEFFQNFSGSSSSYTGSYSLNLDFKKDGIFSFNENVNGKLFSASGTWNFLSNVGGKNKESIVLRIDAASSGGMKDLHFFNKFGTEFVYKLKELRNKELVIEASNKTYIHADGTKEVLSAEYTLTQ